mgnify:CR=1 FL=1
MPESITAMPMSWPKAVGDEPGPRTEHEDRAELRGGQHAERHAGVGEVQDEQGLGDERHPVADLRDDLPAEEQAEVAGAEGAERLAGEPTDRAHEASASSVRSARRSPTAGPNLNPCPPRPTPTTSEPARSRTRSSVGVDAYRQVVARTTSDAAKAQAKTAALTALSNALAGSGSLAEARTAIAGRILSELKGMKRLCPSSLEEEFKMLRRLANADALILRAPHAEALSAGAEVEVIRLDLAGL